MESSLRAVLDLSLARAVLVRKVDAELGGHHGLGLNDLALLLELQQAGGRMRRVELAERLGITTSGVARQLGPLERRGLVGREPSEGDARLVLVTLTEAGARLAGEAEPTAEEAARRALGATWSQQEQASLERLLATVR